MARIRTVKPEFFSSEQVVECSPTARLLFIGLWCFCDDGGVHPYSPRRIKMEVFPGDQYSDDEIIQLLEELATVGLIETYSVEDKHYLIVTGWKHQRIDRPTLRHPSPPARRKLAEQPTNPPRPLTPGEEGKGEEGKGKDSVSGAKAPSTAAPCVAPDAPPADPEFPEPVTGTKPNGNDEDLLDIPLSMLRPPDGDWSVLLFRQGLDWLATHTERTRKGSRAVIGRWLKLTGDDHHAVYDQLAGAQRDNRADPIGWITACLEQRDKAPPKVSAALTGQWNEEDAKNADQ